MKKSIVLSPQNVLVIVFFISYPQVVFASCGTVGMTELVDMDSDKAFDLKITCTPSRYSEKIDDTPSNIIVITQQQIQERGYLNLQDVLQDLPNIDIQKRSSLPNADQYAVRGVVRNNGFLILQDGIRINSPTSEPIPVNDNFPVHYAQKIEVLYGPASAMYGADALTAVVNIITEDPEKIDGVHVKGIAGEYNTYSTYVHAGKKFNDAFSVIAGGHYKQSDNANLPHYYPSQFTFADLHPTGLPTIPAAERPGYKGDGASESAFAKLSFYKDLQIGINYSLFKLRSDWGSPPSGVNYVDNAYINTELLTTYANYNFELNDKLHGFLRANYSWNEMTPESRYNNSFTGFSPIGGYKYALGTRKQLESQLNYKFNDDHTLSGGFSVASYYSIPKTIDLLKPYDTSQSVTGQNAYYLGTDNTLPAKIFEIRYTSVGGYLQLNSNWSEMFSTSLAVRYDKDSRYKNTINPKVGLVFKPVKKLVMKLSYGSAFLAPSPLFTNETFGSFSGTKNANGDYTSSFVHIPNPNLKPETIDTLEYSVSYQPVSDLTVGLSTYYSKLKNLISAATMNPAVTNYVSGGYISSTEANANLGTATIYGGDIHFDYQHNFDDSTLKAWGNYSYVTGKLHRSDQNYETELPMSATHKVKLGLTYSYQDKYTLTPKLYWIGETNSARKKPNTVNVLKTSPGYIRLDLYASAKLTDDFSAFLMVNNLLDKRYYNPGASGGTFDASPQDPRTVMGGFTYQFGK